MVTEIFTIEDCRKIVEIYLRHQKKEISYGLTRSCTDDEMLDDFKLNYSQFIINKIKANAPTSSQLRKLQDPIRNKAERLRSSLVDVENHHLFSSLLYSKFKKPLHEVDDAFFYPAFEEMQERLNGFIDHLNWILEHLEPFREEAFIYPILKDARTHPETTLIKSLSASLTKYFGRGGYSKNDNIASGWRIDAITHLLDRARIKVTEIQIFDALSKG